jgi:hypothetical protein
MYAVSSTGVMEELWTVEPADETERSLPGVGLPVLGRPGVGIPDDRGFWFVDAYRDIAQADFASDPRCSNDRKFPITSCLVYFNPSQGCSPPHLPPSTHRCPPSRGYQLSLQGQDPQFQLRLFHSFPLSSAQTAFNPFRHHFKCLRSKSVGAHEGRNTNHRNVFESEDTVFWRGRGACPVRRYSFAGAQRVGSSSHIDRSRCVPVKSIIHCKTHEHQ